MNRNALEEDTQDSPSQSFARATTSIKVKVSEALCLIPNTNTKLQAQTPSPVENALKAFAKVCQACP